MRGEKGPGKSVSAEVTPSRIMNSVKHQLQDGLRLECARNLQKSCGALPAHEMINENFRLRRPSRGHMQKLCGTLPAREMISKTARLRRPNRDHRPCIKVRIMLERFDN